ncbi:STAS domain-containing protein [Kordiimonas pumila]|uniref:Lipid asymmetry maintenance protein MlaB n=1 Tax=Kordiimonas pumila TaxID=2161677 RepID=A0ABV7D9B4_9PROT|nr:STAS domain-containing protein [Kordiimonas pumila]
MEYQVKTSTKGLLIELHGNLVFEHYRDFKNILSLMKEEKSGVELSLAKLQNMDSAGAGLLKLAKDQAQEQNISFSIVDVPDALRVFVSLI